MIKETDKTKIFIDRYTQAVAFSTANPLFYDKSGLWWLWDDEEKYWKIVDEIDVLNMVHDEHEAETIKSYNRTEILNSLKQVGRKNIPQDAPKSWIQFKSGIIDIKGNIEKIIIPDPNFFITNPIPHRMGASMDTPIIDKLFLEWVGIDYVETLYEIMAYCMITDYPIHRIFCLIGVGSNGKSRYLELLSRFLGEKNITTADLDRLLISRFEITKLYKKLGCLMGETNFNEMNKTSILKQLCGNDLISFEYKNKNPFECKNYSKIIISTNNLPATTDKTLGFYRRWLIIDFPNLFLEGNDVIDLITEQEYENLCYRLIYTLQRLLEKFKFTKEGSVEDRQKKYEAHSNPLTKFLDEFTIEDNNGYIWKKEFFIHLNQWCKENRFREIAENTLGKKMTEKGIMDEFRNTWTENNVKRYRAWVGIRWKDHIEMLNLQSPDQAVQVVQVTSY